MRKELIWALLIEFSRIVPTPSGKLSRIRGLPDVTEGTRRIQTINPKEAGAGECHCLHKLRRLKRDLLLLEKDGWCAGGSGLDA